MEGVAKPGIEIRILAEAVGAEDDVHEVVVDGVIEASGKPAAMTGHAAKADFSLFPRALGKKRPGFVLHAVDAVHGVIEVDVEIVGLQAFQTAFQRRHHLGFAIGCAGFGLGIQDISIPRNALQPLSHRFLGPAEAITFRRVEEGDATIEGMADQSTRLASSPSQSRFPIPRGRSCRGLHASGLRVRRLLRPVFGSRGSQAGHHPGSQECSTRQHPIRPACRKERLF